MRHDLHPTTVSRVWLGAVATGIYLACAGSAAAAPPLEAGIWVSETGRGAVEVRPCGDSGASAKRLCGYIVWLKQPNDKRGRPLTDGRNADTSKRGRPICGLPVLGSLQRVNGGWDKGWVYDPEQGASFDAAIQLSGRNRLVLTGYKGVKFFSKSFTWRRAPADLQRCDQAIEAKATTAPARKATAQAEPQIIPPRPVPAVRPTVIE